MKLISYVALTLVALILLPSILPLPLISLIMLAVNRETYPRLVGSSCVLAYTAIVGFAFNHWLLTFPELINNAALLKTVSLLVSWSVGAYVTAVYYRLIRDLVQKRVV